MSRTLLQKDDYNTQTSLESEDGPCELDGDKGQKIGVLSSLPYLVTVDEAQCVQQVSSSGNSEFPLAASTTFLTILEKNLVHPRTFTQNFLQSILSTIDSRDPVVATAWLDTLLDVIDLLPATVIKSDILPVAIAKGQISEPVSARLTACKLLGKIATKFESYMLKKEVLPLIHSLCQDVNYEVRACICSQLHYVARSLDTETVKPVLLPSLVELASDEESQVRLEAVETIVNMLPNLQTDTLKFTFIPLVKKMCEESLRAEDSVMVKISEQFGKLCLGLENIFTQQEKGWMLQHYQKMAELGLSYMMKSNVSDCDVMPDVVPANTDVCITCRHNCAYNLPAMTMFCSTAGKVDKFIPNLYSTFQNLASDPHFMIRQTVACGLYEIAQMLGSASYMLKPELIRLLRDDAEEVLQVLVPHLGETLVLLAKAGTFSPDFTDCGVLDIGQALLKCEAKISMTNNWRLHALMLGQLKCLPHCMPSDFIYSHFVPIIFDRIHTARPVPCRMAAARTMLIFLRYNVKQMQRNAIRAHIDTDLCCSDSCYKRMLFVNMCDSAVDLFSRCYFKEYFFTPLVRLSDDQVPNIRLKVVTMLPKLKALLYLPGDHKLLTSMEACVCNLLLHEKDRDVKAQLQLTVQALDAIEVGVEVGGSQAPASKDDIEDQRRADEEERLSGTGSALSKWKAGSQTDVKRRSVELKNVPELTVAERKTCLSNIPVSRPIKRSTQHPSTFFDDCPHKSSMNSWQFETATDSISQQAQETYVCLTKHSMMGCCSHSHLKFPHNFLLPEDLEFGKCTAGNKEMHLQAVNLSASALLPQLEAETTNSNVEMRDADDSGGDAATNLHDVTNSTSEKQPANLLSCECKFYALGGMPGPHYGPCMYYAFKPKASYNLHTNNEIRNSELATRLVVSSLEDEFYVDAGIQIPLQLATSGFRPLSSRIPNLREILFKNRTTLSDTNLQNISQKEIKTEYEVSSDARDGSMKSKPNTPATHNVATKTGIVSAASKMSVSVNPTEKKTSSPGIMNRRNSGVFNDEIDSRSQQTSRSKLNVTSKQKPGISATVANKQQSYLGKDKTVKIKSSDINNRNRGSGISENKRGCSLERVQATTSDEVQKCSETYSLHKSNTRSQNLSEAKLSTTTTVTNRQHSYSPVVQNNRSDSTDTPLIKRNVTGPEGHKSAYNSHMHMKRGTSLDREIRSDVIGSNVKRRSMVTPSTVKHTVWRHSSLERDSMDRFLVQTQIQAKGVNKVVDINKTEFSKSKQRELRSLVDNVGSVSKGNNASRIPRGGGTSCHSSPGNSRATSPTGLACVSSSRLHQRTAPNSRASSPTGTEKLQQRLSVGSLSCYLGTLKLAEPGTSRLPIRNFSRLQ